MKKTPNPKLIRVEKRGDTYMVCDEDGPIDGLQSTEWLLADFLCEWVREAIRLGNKMVAKKKKAMKA